jgi:uncharacterized membrane protein YfcA
MVYFEIVGFALLGIVAGFFNGLLGIGCGVLVVPVFITLGWPVPNTMATSHVGVFLSSLAAMYVHRHSKDISRTQILCIAVPAVVTAQLASRVAHSVPPNLVLLGFSAFMFIDLDILCAAQAKKDKLLGAVVEVKPLEKSFFSYLFIGFVTGIVASFFGLGGGLVVIPLLLLLTDAPPKVAVKTSIGVMVLTSTSSLLPHLGSGQINFSVGALLGIGTIFGGLVGSSLMPHLPDAAIKKLISVMLLAAGIHMYFFGITM